MHGHSRHSALRQPSGGGRSPDAEHIAALLTPVINASGMDLEDVRIVSAGRRRQLRVVLDADGGVSLDDIALISRELSAVLDRSEAMGQAAYTLEVSSPGVGRPLTEPRHWRRAVGRLVTAPVQGQQPGRDSAVRSAAVSGRIGAVTTNGVRIDTAAGSREFSFAELGPGRVEVEFGRPGEADGEVSDGH